MKSAIEIIYYALDLEVEIKPNDWEFKSHEEWDSVCAITLISALDEEYGIPLTGDQLEKINTIQELEEYINLKQ